MRIQIYASVDGGLPRLVHEMSRGEWTEGVDIPRVPPLAWGAPHPALWGIPLVKLMGFAIKLWWIRLTYGLMRFCRILPREAA